METKEEKAAIIGIFIKDFDAVPTNGKRNPARLCGGYHRTNRHSLSSKRIACHFHYSQHNA